MTITHEGSNEAIASSMLGPATATDKDLPASRPLKELSQEIARSREDHPQIPMQFRKHHAFQATFQVEREYRTRPRIEHPDEAGIPKHQNRLRGPDELGRLIPEPRDRDDLHARSPDCTFMAVMLYIGLGFGSLKQGRREMGMPHSCLAAIRRALPHRLRSCPR